MEKNYRKTLIACYLGFITQAIAANFAPLLFLKLHTDYAIPLCWWTCFAHGLWIPSATGAVL